MKSENVMSDTLTLEEAGQFATSLTGKNVTPSNINYLIQYGRIDSMIVTIHK